jgi:metaxin
VHCEDEQQISLKFDVYASLLDHRIRNAWLYQLYLHEDNFARITRRLYINPSTTSSLVRFALASQLQQAARNELLKSSSYIDIFDLETDAENAFDALSTLLSEDEFFFGRTTPGIFDASVFAYTHLLLDESMHWKYNRLGQLLRRHPNLVNHRDRLLQQYF